MDEKTFTLVIGEVIQNQLGPYTNNDMAIVSLFHKLKDMDISLDVKSLKLKRKRHEKRNAKDITHPLMDKDLPLGKMAPPRMQYQGE